MVGLPFRFVVEDPTVVFLLDKLRGGSFVYDHSAASVELQG